MQYTYLMECGKTGVCKIGRSNDPEKRLLMFKTSNPFIKLIGISGVKESYLHTKYDKFRFSGEWFEFPREVKYEVYSFFKPFNDENKANILKPLNDETKVNDPNQEILDIVKILSVEFDIVKINEYDNTIYNKLGPRSYRKLLRTCNEFRDLMTNAMLMSI